MRFAFLRGTGSTSQRLAVAAAVAVCLTSVQCSRSPTEPSTGPNTPVPSPPPSTPTPAPSPGGPALFSGAGDIANCDTNADPQKRNGWWNDASGATGRLLDNIGGTIFTLGDNAYPHGQRADYTDCYDRMWGRHKSRTFPVPGNHDYGEGAPHQAMPFFDYFGETFTGPRGLGYQVMTVGAWRVYQLNSNHKFGIGVDGGGAQAAWLRADLQANPTRCSLAYWHHPLFSSGSNGGDGNMRAIFQILYEAGADVVLNGHDHIYERFAMQAPDGRSDPTRGIRQFTVGTGGTYPLSPVVVRQPNSEHVVQGQFGILKMTLNPENYSWEFISTTTGVQDSGSTACH